MTPQQIDSTTKLVLACTLLVVVFGVVWVLGRLVKSRRFGSVDLEMNGLTTITASIKAVDKKLDDTIGSNGKTVHEVLTDMKSRMGALEKSCATKDDVAAVHDRIDDLASAGRQLAARVSKVEAHPPTKNGAAPRKNGATTRKTATSRRTA